tara:strand:+ start:18986 stop:19390 length:405 start_codon:yes stop_codon:yes gene_type:complete
MWSPSFSIVILLTFISLLSCSDEEKNISNQQKEIRVPYLELNRSSKVKIAVIGGGIGGASYCHFITQALGDQVDITVYEKSDRIGGRVKKEALGGGLIEQGATLIHSSNHYLQHIMKEHHLNRTILYHMEAKEK